MSVSGLVLPILCYLWLPAYRKFASEPVSTRTNLMSMQRGPIVHCNSFGFTTIVIVPME